MSNGVIYPIAGSVGLRLAPAPNGGSGDQSASLQAWLNSLAGSELGILLPGTYGVSSPIVQPSNTHLVSPGSTILWTGGANPAAVWQFGTSSAACVRSSVLGQLRVDANSVANGIGFVFHSTQHCFTERLEARNCFAGGFEWLADASAGGDSDFGNQNNAANTFVACYAYNCFTSFYGHGVSGSAVVTNNRFGLLYCFACAGNGLYFDQWADSNSFDRVVIALNTNSTNGLLFNSSGASDQGVYGNVITLATVDLFGLTGVKALIFGKNANGIGNTILGFETGTAPFSSAGGALLSNLGGAVYDVNFLSESPPYRRLNGYHAEVLEGAAPAATSLAANGSTGTATLSADSTDRRGTITITPSGTGITAGAVAQLAFASAYLNAPRVNIIPANGNAFTIGGYVIQANTTTAHAQIVFNSAPGSGNAFAFNYTVLD